MTIKTTLKAMLTGVALLASSVDAFSWGQKGHDITCAIAQQHLTRKAARQIDRILEGRSIVYWSSWMDTASHTPEYAYTRTWHYKNIDADETYDGAAVNESGDVVTAINAQIDALKSGTLNKEQTQIALRMLVHLVGDVHCPMHMGHRSDSGGNKWQIQYFGQGKNLHGIWDSDVLESSRKWTYSEWTKEIDILDRKTAARIAEGTPYEWGRETHAITSQIYAGTPVGSKLSYDYVRDWSPVIEQQLLKGGIRLAAILNDIFR